MIIWRGWGVIGAAFPLIGMIIGLGIWSGTGAKGTPMPFFGPALIIAGVGTYLLGRHLNVSSVDQKTEQHLAPRRAQVDQLVHSGQFQLAPGMPQPRSFEEAQQQAGMLLEHERSQIRAQLEGRHTLFFIPVQWVGLAVAAAGLILAVAGIVVAITG